METRTQLEPQNDNKPSWAQAHFPIILPAIFSTNFTPDFRHRFPPSVHFEASVGRSAYHRGMPPPCHTMEECPYYRSCPLSDPKVSLFRLLGVHWAGVGLGVHNTWHRPPATWHPAHPSCSRSSDPAATASDESGPRSAPNPSQPVANLPFPSKSSSLIS